jgi:cysteine desulfurase
MAPGVDCKDCVRAAMAGERVYLDYNATAPIRPAVAEAVARALGVTGNPSSVHAEGRTARGLIEEAREKVAALVGAKSRDVVFTSGGTEAANTVLRPGLHRPDGSQMGRCLVSATEHVSVLQGTRFGPGAIEVLPVDRDGIVDLAHLTRQLAAGVRALVSIQTANNETGVLQPVAEAARLTHAAGGLIHTDAVQAAGKIRLDITALGVDALSLSAHKLGGPMGVGAFVLNGAQLDDKLLCGGGQERGLRGGTENVAGIVGFGAAAEIAIAELEASEARLSALRAKLEAGIMALAPDAIVFGGAVERLPNTTAFAVPGIKAETLLMRLDLDGIAVSSGSACSSGKVRRSHVLEAMGVPQPLAEGAIRVSTGWNTREDDVTHFVQACERALHALHMRRVGRAA